MEEPAQGRQMRGRFMSNYGLKTYTPEQIKEQWRESMKVLVHFSFWTKSFKLFDVISFVIVK